jgi:hypothetical protein
MTSKLIIPKISKESKMAESMKDGIKSLVGKKMTKNTKFMGVDLKIQKLSISEVLSIQERAKDAEKNEAEGFNVLKLVVRSAVEGADELSDEDFDNFPLDELSKLSTEIMKFSGIGQEQGK